MISRRTLLPALALFGTTAAAGLWRPKQVSADQQPRLTDLEREIYSQELSRGYRNANGDYIMLLIAYGPSQSEYLQLHQPEVCYVAQGFRVKPVVSSTMRLDGGGELPLRRLSAWRAGRPEPVTYWTRVGDVVTRSQLDRLYVKFRRGLAGFIPDGLLVRISSISPDAEPAFEMQDDFIRQMLLGVSPPNRHYLIGRLASSESA